MTAAGQEYQNLGLVGFRHRPCGMEAVDHTRAIDEDRQLPQVFEELLSRIGDSFRKCYHFFANRIPA